ncbi:hypothetical protein CFD26_105771 [Aspergillus turcosus]|uniref:Succinate-semialdehyde dehydrogenase n=1 Tax=Aspergillus turcosus TaxID=1245748 RepID=A0A3R7LY04_9EURO|nr:hypothetical protein CFD26_105771 [Aspergillus turcosus]
MGHIVPKLNDDTLYIERAFVNGEWVSATSGGTFPVYGKCPEFSAEDTVSAVYAANQALPGFRKTLARERARMLRRWYELVLENAEDLATLVTWENGKPLADARDEINYAASFLEWFSEEAPRVYGDTIPSTIAGQRIITVREPVGICALITPWNFPAAMITRKIGAALAAGCTVIVKAPAETPFTANAIVKLAQRAGIPKGVINIVTGLKNTAAIGEVLTTHPYIRKLSFTGSTNVGRLLMGQAASTIKRVSLELGGNSPFIVFEDVRDIEHAVTAAIKAKFRSSGQTCVCANRIYVHRAIFDQFAELFTQEVRKFKLGPGFNKDTTHGPLIHQRAIDKVDEHVRDAVLKGAKVVTGGRRAPEVGVNFYEPTILIGMTEDMLLAKEETFGPVAALFSFETEEEVVGLANNSEVGLAGYFFCADIQRAIRVAGALEVGMVGLNTGSISDAALPFGGMKQSGFGREGSKYGIEEYLEVKAITLGGST